MKNATCGWETWSELDALKLTGFGYEALLVPALGANTIRLTYREGDQLLHILRSPDSASDLLQNPYEYGAPILFPANRISGAGYTWEGIRYSFPVNCPDQMHIHGVLHNRAWPVAGYGADADKAWVQLALDTDQDAALHSHFPVPMQIVLSIELTPEGLGHRFTVINKSDRHQIPAGLAYHTAFQVAFSGDAGHVRLHVPIAKRSVDHADTWLPTGQFQALDDYEKQIASAEGADPLLKEFDGIFLAREDAHEAVLRDRTTGWEVVYRADPVHRYWLIWNKTAQDGFVCVEPQTWLSNAMNSPSPATRHAAFVPPQGRWGTYCTIGARRR
ncbi:MAG: aldose 1-epimerase [Clostridiales bacterium]|nr:aldose 1-epimerase [Clostridiales bacterium]